jgi:hypothetical protein
MSSIATIAIGFAALIAATAFALQVLLAIARSLRTSSGIWTAKCSASADSVSDELRYYLPKTVLHVTVNYTLIEKRPYSFGIPSADPPVLARVHFRSVQVEPRLVADEEHPLCLRGGDGGSTRDLNESFAFGEDGTLQALNATVADRTAEVFESVLSAAGRLTVLATGLTAGTGSRSVPMRTQPDNAEEIETALRKALRAAYQDLIDGKADPLIPSRITTLQAMLREFVAGNGEKEVPRDLTFEKTLDDPPEPQLELKDDATGQVVSTLSLSLTPADGNTQALEVTDLPADKKHVAGVLYRVPRPVRLQIDVVPDQYNAGGTIFDKVIPIAQFGALAKCTTDSRPFESVTTSMKFSTQTGRLKELSRQSTSSAALAATKVATAADAMAKNIDDMRRKTGDQAELDRLQVQTKLLIAREKNKQAQNPAEAAKMVVV